MTDSQDTPDLKPQWFQILLAIADKDLHGYGIMNEVLERTEGTMRLWPGTLYGSLKRMLEQGLVREVAAPEVFESDDRERRFYSITGLGQDALRAEAGRLASYVDAARTKNVLEHG